MSRALIVITAGRAEYLRRTITSQSWALPAFDHYYMVDDSQRPEFGEHLDESYGDVFKIHHAEESLGFNGAIQAAWDMAAPDDAWFFHLEEDFTFNEAVDIHQIIDLFEQAQDLGCQLAQISFKRQPWNPAERTAGDFVKVRESEYELLPLASGDITRHKVCFTTNPSLYPRDIVDHEWPQVEHSEGIFTHQLIAEGYEFAIFGRPLDPPRVEHIGFKKVGGGF